MNKYCFENIFHVYQSTHSDCNIFSFTTEALFVRGYSTIATLLLSIVVSIIYEFFYRYHRKSGFELLDQQQAEDEKFGEHNLAERALNSDWDSLHGLEFPFKGQIGGRMGVEIIVEYGRPELDHVVQGVCVAKQPGAFFCGPGKLLENIKDRIRKGRRYEYGRFCTNCCIYAEDFGI